MDLEVNRLMAQRYQFRVGLQINMEDSLTQVTLKIKVTLLILVN